MKRRDFLKTTIIAGTALVIPACTTTQKPHSGIIGVNDDIRVAVVGLRNQGRNHIGYFRNLPGVRVVAVCDPDRDFLDRETEEFGKRNETVKTYKDIRNLLDDPSIDAVIIATPNHWHSLAAIWACQAGKDVYVEKPVSHNIFEGRKMIEAARKYNRIVQAGTQKRSDPGLQEAFEYIQQGNLGKILLARGFCYKRRESIGKVSSPQPIPDSVNYDLWCGPSPKVPLMRKNLHYDWHWVWPTGNGDIGNQGIHEVDLCRWALGQKGLPPSVMSFGGRFGYIDDGETPNTQIIIYDYKPAPLIFEVRGLPAKTDDAAMDNYKGIRIGIVIHCEHGYFAGGAGGGWVYDNSDEKIKQFKGDGGAGHHANFIKAVRSRKVSDLNADIVEGHISTALCHMGNLSYRVGAESSQEEIKESIQSSRGALDSLERFGEHLAANCVDLKKTPAVLGSWLKMDTTKEKFIDGHDYKEANKLLTRKYRKPYIVSKRI